MDKTIINGLITFFHNEAALWDKKARTPLPSNHVDNSAHYKKRAIRCKQIVTELLNHQYKRAIQYTRTRKLDTLDRPTEFMTYSKILITLTQLENSKQKPRE